MCTIFMSNCYKEDTKYNIKIFCREHFFQLVNSRKEQNGQGIKTLCNTKGRLVFQDPKHESYAQYVSVNNSKSLWFCVSEKLQIEIMK